MNVILKVIDAHRRSAMRVEALSGDWLLPTLARACFAAVLFMFFWQSAMTKLGTGITGLFDFSKGAYFQIVPGAVEAAGYQTDKVGFFAHVIVFFGTWGEILLPLLLLFGLFTRLAGLGMIGFIVVMTYVDLTFHGLKPELIGGFFDPSANGLLDQRLLWLLLLAIPVLKGPGPVSLDFALGRLLDEMAARLQPVSREQDAGIH
ncbi:MAG: DoxX family membrane protein [Rhodospirillales bacterium]|nr:DoxX family membrane protein [Rhodospirillales bacterium]